MLQMGKTSLILTKHWIQHGKKIKSHPIWAQELSTAKKNREHGLMRIMKPTLIMITSQNLVTQTQRIQILILRMKMMLKSRLKETYFASLPFLLHFEELINSHGHICNFYPKYHCELNFIEQYWRTAKFHYWSTPKISDTNEMEQNVIACLEEIPQLQILRYVVIFLAWKIFLSTCYLYTFLRYANHAAKFIDSYTQGLSGPEATWANKKYHGDCNSPSWYDCTTQEIIKRVHSVGFIAQQDLNRRSQLQ